MISVEDNDRLTRIGPGTPMGEYMRRFWLPVLASTDLPAGEIAPRSVRLLGESLVMFRTDDGRVGLMPDRCPHRGAKLSLGRSEGPGLRCVYHGWMMDAAGRVIESPNVRHGTIKADACGYRTAERGGLIWAYLGASEAPELPRFPWGDDGMERLVVQVVVRCNWLQCVEGTLDPAHASFLHRDGYRTVTNRVAEGQRESLDGMVRAWPTADTSPALEIDDHPGGFRVCVKRRTSDGSEDLEYRRVQSFFAPFVVMASQPDHPVASISIPIDDRTTMLFTVRWSPDQHIDADAIRARLGVVPGVDVDADGIRRRTPENNWLQDRDAMARGELYWGVPGAIEQDATIWESLGPIHDRTREVVCGANLAIVHLRRSLLAAVDELAAGVEPPQPGPFPLPAQLLPWQAITPITKAWKAPVDS